MAMLLRVGASSPLGNVARAQQSASLPRAFRLPVAGQQRKQGQAARSSMNPVRAFPWDVAASRLGSRLGDLAWSTFKWLSLPTLLASSAGEVLYAAGQGKALLVPLAMFLGVVVAGVIHETALELMPEGAGFRWHLVVMAAAFAFIKLPGPSYPVWGRLFLPHFANGALWQACFLLWRSRI